VGRGCGWHDVRPGRGAASIRGGPVHALIGGRAVAGARPRSQRTRRVTDDSDGLDGCTGDRRRDGGNRCLPVTCRGFVVRFASRRAVAGVGVTIWRRGLTHVVSVVLPAAA
jgi:hypothetical protein